ncbi:hypothetical protein D3C78_1328870 [compost metagenome]
MHIHWQNRDLERGDSIWPDDAAIVMILFDSRRHHASDPNTVAAHGQDLITAVFALNRRLHCFRVLGAELEDMADFDTAFDQQCAFTVRAGIAFNDVTDIGNLRQRQIALPVDTEVVFTVNVGTGAKIAHRCDAAVGYDRNLQIDRAE